MSILATPLPLDRRASGGKDLLCRLPLFTRKRMKVVNTAADAAWCKTMRTQEKDRKTSRYLHGWVDAWGRMAFFTVCVGRREEDLLALTRFILSGEPLKPNQYPGLLWTLGRLFFSFVPLGGSLLLLLLELLDGVHLSPGARLAHRGAVLALPHQLGGHLAVFLRRRKKSREMRTAKSEGKKGQNWQTAVSSCANGIIGERPGEWSLWLSALTSF